MRPAFDAAPDAREVLDAIVVGAGPAGSVAALLLARAGRRVALLDRAAFPRPKPCGDCVSAGAVPLLRRLGLLERVRACGPSVLAGWRIDAGTGAAFHARFRSYAVDDDEAASLAVRRERLDAALLAAAVDAGADFRPGWHVADLCRGPDGRVRGVSGRSAAAGGANGGAPRSTLHARLVVGADGLRSVVARRLGVVRRRPRLRKLSLTAHLTGVHGIGHFGEMHLGDHFCVGVAPVDSGMCNVTLVADAGRYGSAAAAGRADFFRSTVLSLPSLRDRMEDACCGVTGERLCECPPALLASGPFDVPVRGAFAAGAALVGDAAGYFDPFTGQGIHTAIQDAVDLAECLVPALAQPGDVPLAPLRKYARRRARRARSRHALQRAVEAILSRRRLRTLALRRLGAAPSVAAAVVAATGGLIEPARLISARLLATFLLSSTVEPTA